MASQRDGAAVAYDKDIAEELLNRKDLHGDILHEVGKIVAGEGIKIADALLRGEFSIHAPDLCYVSGGIMRVKRPQEHLFILSPGGSVGIDTAWSVLQPVFTKPVEFNQMTRGSLTSRDNITEKLLDRSLIFLREFYTLNNDLVNDVKSIMEERKLSVYRSYDQGAQSADTHIKVAPAIFVGCNSVTKALDTPFYSRFDTALILNHDKQTLLEIKDRQVSTLPTRQEIENLLKDNSERISKLAEYKHAPAWLADRCSDDYYILTDNVRDKFNEGISKILDRSDERIRSRFPRDVEAGYRAMHNNAWLKQLQREREDMPDGLGSRHYIYANEEDAEVGISHTKNSYELKQQFLEILDDYEIRDKRTKQREREFYNENYDFLKNRSYRDQETWLRNAGYIISHKTIADWDKKQKKLMGGL